MKPIEQDFELKLKGGEIVTWTGTDGVNAAQRYADCHANVTVVAWKVPATAIVIGTARIEG